MAIIYDKLFEMMKLKGLTTYQIRKRGIITEPILQRLRKNEIVRTQAINDLCAALDCQPGDIMEYIPDKEKKQEP